MTLHKLGFVGIVAITCGVGCGGPTEPAAGSLRHGLYVLATIDRQPPPLVTDRLDFGDTLSTFYVVDYDSIRIVNDTLFERHYSKGSYQQRTGEAPTLVMGSSNLSFPGLILPRDGEVVLLPMPYGFPAPDPESFAVRPEGLLRRIRVTRSQCINPIACTVVANRFVDALYTRR